MLRWQQVNVVRRDVRVGKSKTEAGEGRTVPLNDRATKVLQFWADQFPDRRAEHFVFATERYGAISSTRACFIAIPPGQINSWKEAWESAKERAKVTIRFHDLRHTCVIRMLEGGVPLSVVASILDWSAATIARMAKRYGHIGQVP
ncbi:MAG TPA: tyrosine-type recombinase/integrase [Vicinamibacterales bacterium]|nr:tyrosine-type recombinase/integrase [Vicinamibacterales bacterium]